jgi:hypothetical protein
MWENWEKEELSNGGKYYALPLHLKIKETEMVIELTVTLLPSDNDSKNWQVLITTFHPSSGEHIVFEDTLHSFQEAENKAWERAQKSINIRKKWMLFGA